MKLTILSWNVREANDCNKRMIIKSFIKSHTVDLVCLQETKVQVMSVRLVLSFGLGRFLEWDVVNLIGVVPIKKKKKKIQ